ncbi:uncharacterized protein LOC129590526 isoform X1 [Paramacrobiotus metropolitanus]|uniref:uncharacterized protein LOC129590526 isoform X1 n=1 Tax=Paramacrobiotus metropolitanus TaxID=2943436 RepID=UPI0024462478|nr:uncharacterized protein LOC129590526 isoform X1 [Paramacrobiotus metropolitanus]
MYYPIIQTVVILFCFIVKITECFKIPATGGLLSQLTGASQLSGLIDTLLKIPNRFYDDRTVYAATTAASYPDVSAYTIGPGVSYPVVVGIPNPNYTKGTSTTDTVVEKYIPQTDKAYAALPPLTVIVHTDNRPLNVISAPPNINHISIRPPLGSAYPAGNYGPVYTNSAPVAVDASYVPNPGYVSSSTAVSAVDAFNPGVTVINSAPPCKADGFIPGPGVTVNCGDQPIVYPDIDTDNYIYNGISYPNSAGSDYLNPPVAYPAVNHVNTYSSPSIPVVQANVIPVLPSSGYGNNNGNLGSYGSNAPAYNAPSVSSYGASGQPTAVAVGEPLTPIFASGVYASAGSDPPDGYNSKPATYPTSQTYVPPVVDSVVDVIGNVAGQIYSATDKLASAYNSQGKPSYGKGQTYAGSYGDSGNSYGNPSKSRPPYYSGEGEYPPYPNQNHINDYENQYKENTDDYGNQYGGRPNKRPSDYDFEIDHNVDNVANSLFFNPNNQYPGGSPQFPSGPYGYGAYGISGIPRCRYRRCHSMEDIPGHSLPARRPWVHLATKMVILVLLLCLVEVSDMVEVLTIRMEETLAHTRLPTAAVVPAILGYLPNS